MTVHKCRMNKKGHWIFVNKNNTNSSTIADNNLTIKILNIILYLYLYLII